MISAPSNTPCRRARQLGTVTLPRKWPISTAKSVTANCPGLQVRSRWRDPIASWRDRISAAESVLLESGERSTFRSLLKEAPHVFSLVYYGQFPRHRL